jgi:hypothetical protein
MRVTLNQSVSIVLDGSGNGTTQTGPLTAREIWYPENVHVSVKAPVIKEATCKIYVGDGVRDGTFRDGTYSGSSGDSTDKVNADMIKVGWKVFAVWNGGDTSAVATMVVTGTKEV